MTSTSRFSRITLTEYGAFESIREHALRIGVAESTLERYLTQTSQRISQALHINQPIMVLKDYFRVVGIAGLICLAPNIELEVRPKFLEADIDSWREDFFAVATIARFGRVFPEEALRSTSGERGDLADLLGRAVVALFDRNYRRPLRAYRHALWRDFAVDGELDPESLLFAENSGFLQSGLVFDQQNQFNSVIYLAMTALLKEVRNGDLRKQVLHRQVRLSPQLPIPHIPIQRSVPSRHRKWQELYDLSRQILEGFGIQFAETSTAVLPGYLIKTDDAWESLLFSAVRAGFPDRNVSKRPFFLGKRTRPGYDDRNIHTTPDITILQQNGSVLVVDAKYKSGVNSDKIKNTNKSKSGNGSLSIAPADLYEALAFLLATSTQKAILLYPSAGGNSTQPPGTAIKFESARVGSYEVMGYRVNVRGISGVGGFKRFVTNLCAVLGSLEAS